jgi:zinc protease
VRGRHVWLVDKPGAAQSALRVGRVGPPRLNPDYHALEVMNTLLGGSFTSRLNDNLREKHGYAYGAASWFDYRRVGGMFLGQADVQTDATAPAVAELLQELARIRTPAPAEEVERARNYLALGYAWDFETTRQLAGRLAGQELYSLPEDFFGSFVPKTLAVGPPEVERAALSWVDPENMALVVVGDRAKIEAPLRGLGKGTLRLLTVGDVMGPPPQVR